MINELQLELSIKCNSKCVMCPRDSVKRNTKGGFMDTELAKKIIDDAYEAGARMIKPQWFGESMLHPNYIEILQYAKDKGYRIVIFTNGSLLNREMREALIDIGVDKTFVSIDTCNKNEYEKIRVGLDFDIVLKNVKNFYKHKKPEMKLLISAVELGKNNTVGINYAFSGISDDITVNNTVEYNKISKEKKKKVICKHNVRSRLVVAFDGKCYLCCHDWLGEYYIGDYKMQTIKEIWDSNLRKDKLDNLKSLNICQFCQ